MRIWSLHPKYLDARGLVALWREALLAQAVLRGQTRGYTHHPQLARFREQPSPAGAVAEYLRTVQEEAGLRGYRFDAGKILDPSGALSIPVTEGQLRFEWDHLMAKLDVRDPAWKKRLGAISAPEPHPVFRVIAGGLASWERASAPTLRSVTGKRAPDS